MFLAAFNLCIRLSASRRNKKVHKSFDFIVHRRETGGEDAYEGLNRKSYVGSNENDDYNVQNDFR